MSEQKIDLWSQFANDREDVIDSLEKQPPKKKAVTDGSEWSGQFDRRSTFRGADSGQVVHPNDQALQLSDEALQLSDESVQVSDDQAHLAGN